jgi:hypothetical protein
MGIYDIIKMLLGQTKKIEVKHLPTQGLFYPEDFELRIKKADMEDIIDYEYNFDKDNIFTMIESVKKIVKNNTHFNEGYRYEDIKSVDIVYIFLEIVKFTTNKKIEFSYFNDKLGKPDKLEFTNQNFNYFDFSKWSKNYDKEKRGFLLDGYNFTMPSIGVETCITEFLIQKSEEPGSNVYNSYNYDFSFFIGNKNNLNFSEIENLIQIFTFDLDDREQKKLKDIKQKFLSLINYSIKNDGKVIEFKSKLDLETIWK